MFSNKKIIIPSNANSTRFHALPKIHTLALVSALLFVTLALLLIIALYQDSKLAAVSRILQL